MSDVERATAKPPCQQRWSIKPDGKASRRAGTLRVSRVSDKSIVWLGPESLATYRASGPYIYRHSKRS